MMALLPALAIWALAVLAQALFAGYETGLVSCNPIRIRFLAEEERNSRAARLLKCIERPDLLLTSLLIGTNIAVVISTITVTVSVQALFPEANAGLATDLVSTLIVTPVLLVFSEIIPKSIFRIHPNRLALALFPVVRFFQIALAPVAWPVTHATRLLLRLFGGEEPQVSSLMSSLEDLRVLIDEGADTGTIEREEQEMIHSVMDLQSTLAKEVMVPRIHVRALPDTAERDELLALFQETGYTRIPIYRESIDEVIGKVNAYDLLVDADVQNQDIHRFVTEVIHVPDTMTLDDLFQLLKDKKEHMAIVTDEYGGTDGLITIEDILEEIFGDIQDEHDEETRSIQRVGPNAYIVEARTPLEDLAEALGTAVSDEEVETVGGWLMHLTGRVPAPGESLTHGRFLITVIEGTPSRIDKIRLDVSPQVTPAEGGSGQTE